MFQWRTRYIPQCRQAASTPSKTHAIQSRPASCMSCSMSRPETKGPLSALASTISILLGDQSHILSKCPFLSRFNPYFSLMPCSLATFGISAAPRSRRIQREKSTRTRQAPFCRIFITDYSIIVLVELVVNLIFRGVKVMPLETLRFLQRR